MKKQLNAHKLYSTSDYQALRQKGYTANEIRQIWDRDWKRGARKPLVRKTAPQVVEYLKTKGYSI